MVFIKFWLYNLLFFYIGVLVAIPITMIDSYALAYNMQFSFTSELKVTLVVTILQWLCNDIAILFWLGKFYDIFPFKIEL